ncbi:pentraxin-related protein PTX3-like [Phymastichus coffea]|uniref:pentraxin-related protein PTX3-like n=1 Tax=Phymastichus coffea TaxID=108790 RepID=UPI00273CC5B1|nr:pentraxin-related protein PTX3-like [Phymastichus coffea]
MLPLQRLHAILALASVVLMRLGVADAATTPMHKVLLTQRGYIQFLRWEMPLPEIREFTYCLWMKSVNYTLRNSIFSYSHNETQRRVSAWVSAYGQSVHLEIGSVEVMAVPVNLQEHRWYHLCQSWDSRDGQFALWIDAHVVAHGYAKQMAGHVIPANGDPVVGQEYTDFDKGLEEGIEGAVLGFNLLLVSAFAPRSRSILRSASSYTPFGFVYAPKYFTSNFYNWPTSKNRGRQVVRKVESDPLIPGETIGEYLVRMTYEHCQRGRASPFINPTVMIISWTRTPVKIFGGAVVKNALGTCGHFG